MRKLPLILVIIFLSSIFTVVAYLDNFESIFESKPESEITRAQFAYLTPDASGRLTISVPKNAGGDPNIELYTDIYRFDILSKSRGTQVGGAECDIYPSDTFEFTAPWSGALEVCNDEHIGVVALLYHVSPWYNMQCDDDPSCSYYSGYGWVGLHLPEDTCGEFFDLVEGEEYKLDEYFCDDEACDCGEGYWNIGCGPEYGCEEDEMLRQQECIPDNCHPEEVCVDWIAPPESLVDPESCWPSVECTEWCDIPDTGNHIRHWCEDGEERTETCSAQMNCEMISGKAICVAGDCESLDGIIVPLGETICVEGDEYECDSNGLLSIDEDSPNCQEPVDCYACIGGEVTIRHTVGGCPSDYVLEPLTQEDCDQTCGIGIPCNSDSDCDCDPDLYCKGASLFVEGICDYPRDSQGNRVVDGDGCSSNSDCDDDCFCYGFSGTDFWEQCYEKKEGLKYSEISGYDLGPYATAPHKLITDPDSAFCSKNYMCLSGECLKGKNNDDVKEVLEDVYPTWVSIPGIAELLLNFISGTSRDDFTESNGLCLAEGESANPVCNFLQPYLEGTFGDNYCVWGIGIIVFLIFIFLIIIMKGK